MKQIILTLSVLITSFSSFAQQYVPMPTDSAWWMYRSVMGGEGHTEYTETLILAAGDTVWSGHTYTKLMKRSDNYDVFNGNPFPTSFIADHPDVFVGGMREENKVVYVRRYGIGESILFDFNLQVGGTFQPNQNTTVTVTAIDDVLVGSTYRKRYTTTGGVFIEGIGNRNSGVMNQYGSLVCFKAEQSFNTGYYSPQNSNDCHYIFPYGTALNVSTTETENELSIFPNPFTDRINIDIATPGTLGMYNSLGQCIKKMSYSNAGKHSIDNLSNLPSGLYFININDRDGKLITTKKLMKQ